MGRCISLYGSIEDSGRQPPLFILSRIMLPLQPLDPINRILQRPILPDSTAILRTARQGSCHGFNRAIHTILLLIRGTKGLGHVKPNEPRSIKNSSEPFFSILRNPLFSREGFTNRGPSTEIPSVSRNLAPSSGAQLHLPHKHRIESCISAPG